MVTEDFARAGTRAFITGVAYSDADGDRFYDIGEGRGGVTFDRLDDSSGAVSTQAAGGYALGLPTGLSGSTTVAVSSGGTTREVSLAMTGGNVKLDLVGTTLASSTSMALGARAQDGLLLGAASLQLTGNGLDNHLTGNRASNLISGAGGNDVISGGNGNDRLLGGDGADRIEGGTGTDTFTGGAGSDNFVFTVKSGAPTGSDTITDLQSGDRITVDLPSLPGSSSAWEDGHISSVSGGVQIALDDGSRILVSNTISHSLVHDALVLV
jgi:Ca2+-binding RTX toxin-like protein